MGAANRGKKRDGERQRRRKAAGGRFIRGDGKRGRGDGKRREARLKKEIEAEGA